MAQPRQFKVSLVDIFIIIASLVMFAVLNWKTPLVCGSYTNSDYKKGQRVHSLAFLLEA